MPKITAKYKSIIQYWRSLRFILLFLVIASCDSFCGIAFDCGCIEADDFGEFQQELIEVKANSISGSCEYDVSKPLDGDTQGSGLRACLIGTGSSTIAIEDPIDPAIVHLSTSGCEGFDANNGGPIIRHICVNQCIQSCQLDQISSSATAQSPFWEPTSKTLSIEPGYEISIIANGAVNLSEDVTLGPFFVKPNNFHFHSKAVDSDNNIIDVKKGGNKAIRVHGKWKDTKDSGNDDNNWVGPGSNDYISGTSAQKTQIYSGLRRLVAYVDPHPAGYSYDVTESNDKAATKGTPMYVNHKLWRCEYDDNDVTELHSNCYSLAYNTTNGYPNIYTGLDLSHYSITSLGKAENLGRNGGIIRWDSLNVSSFDDEYNPFQDSSGDKITCHKSGNCDSSNNDYIKVSRGEMIGKSLKGTGEDSGYEYVNNNSNSSGAALPVTVSFVSLYPDNRCDGKMHVKHFDAQGNVIIGDSQIDIDRNWGKNKSLWYLEAGDKLKMWGVDKEDDGFNCARAYAFRVDLIAEVEIEKSGIVSFSMLGEETASGTCKLNLRIVNPSGNRQDFREIPGDGNSKLFEDDFYEYGNSQENLSHPTSEISVSASKLGGINKFNWSEEIFVRKGQRLRFSAKSWSGNWQASATKVRKCGIGMAMKIKPRLALLCRGRATESAKHSKCKVASDPSANDGKECEAYARECTEIGNSSFCSLEDCQLTDLVAFDAAGCEGRGMDFGQCSSCKTIALWNKNNLSQTIPVEIDQCYDLEEYKGKVSNIYNEFALEQLSNSVVAKGAKKLDSFDGGYGNFNSFTTDGVDASGNIIYKLGFDSPMLYAGRLKFLILDGEDFNGTNDSNIINGYRSYNGNPSNTNFDGSNGFHVELRGSDEHYNGAMLEVRLCKDTEVNGQLQQLCADLNPPEITTQPYVVKIDSTSIYDSEIKYLSHYKFNDAGRLVRISNADAAGHIPVTSVSTDCKASAPALNQDCSAGCDGVMKTNPFFEDLSANQGQVCGATEKIGKKETPNRCQKEHYCDKIDDRVGTDFYVHSETDNSDKIRLTFKILDTDIPNCRKGGPSLNQHCLNNTCDGIILKNAFFASGVGNNNSVCSSGTNIGSGISDCKRQYYCGSVYANNSGSYKVLVRVKNPAGADVSSIVDNVVGPVVEIMDGTEEGVVPKKLGQAERIYTLLITNPTFKVMTQIIFILAITFYGIGYLMGVSQFSQGEIISRIVRISIIYLFIGSNGWYWFDAIFVNFFKEGTDYLAFLMATSFDTSPELEQALANNDFYDKSVLFSSIDNVFGIFFSDAAQKKIAALLFASIFGWAYMYIIYMGFLLYVWAVANAVLLYLTSQVFISILFVIGPIFFLFLFFNQTKEMFDKWLGQLIGFSLQQIFLLTTLAFFNMMMYEILKLALGYRVCWDDVLVINVPIRMTLLSFWTVASMPPRLSTQSPVGNIGVNSGIPSIFSILFIWVIASLMKQFITFMTDLAASIGGGVKASAMGSGLTQAAQKFGKGIGNIGSKAWKGSGQKVTERLDKYLFDSGRQADKARKERKIVNRKNLKTKRSMVNSGDKAAKAYRIKHADSLAKLPNKEAVDKKVNEAMIKGQMARAKELGLNEKEAKTLLADKGVKYEGHNVFGYAAQAGKQMVTKGGSVFTAMKDKKANSKFSKTDVKKAMRNTDAQGRLDITSGIRKGNLQVKATENEKMGWKRKLAAVTTLGATEAAIRGGKAAGRGVGAVGDKYNKEKRYDKARKQLENEGSINRRRFEIGRGSGEKDAIRKRMKENFNQSNVGLAKNSDKDIAFAMHQKVVVDEVQGLVKDEDRKFTNKDGAWSDMFGKEKAFKRGSKKADLKQHKAYLQSDRSEKMSALKEERSAAQTSFDGADNSYQESLGKVNDLKSSGKIAHLADLEDKSKDRDKLGNAQKRLDKQINQKDISPIEKTRLGRLQNTVGLEKEKADRFHAEGQEVRNSPEYKQEFENLQDANATALGHERVRNNYESRLENIDGQIDNIKKDDKYKETHESPDPNLKAQIQDRDERKASAKPERSMSVPNTLPVPVSAPSGSGGHAVPKPSEGDNDVYGSSSSGGGEVGDDQEIEGYNVNTEDDDHKAKLENTEYGESDDENEDP